MSLLRETIRRILLENNESKFPKLMKLLNGPQEDVAQGLALAEGLGLIDKYKQDKTVETAFGGSEEIVHHLHDFECLDPDFYEYVRVNKKDRTQDPNKWWQFKLHPNYAISITIRVDG